MQKISILILFFFSMSQHVNAELWSAYNAGIGMGSSRLTGDFIRDQSGNTFEFGINVNQEYVLFRLLARTEMDNRFKGEDLIIGYGNRYIKIGTGLTAIQGTIPTRRNNDTTINDFNLIQGDSRYDTDVSVTTIPLLLSITPYHSNNFMFNIEGYYGLYSKGSMTIPIIVLGFDAYLQTEPQRQGGARGYSVSMTWRLNSIDKNLAVKLQYRYQQAHMNKQETRIQQDILGLFGTVTMPELDLEQETIMLSVVFLTD